MVLLLLNLPLPCTRHTMHQPNGSTNIRAHLTLAGTPQRRDLRRTTPSWCYPRHTTLTTRPKKFQRGVNTPRAVSTCTRLMECFAGFSCSYRSHQPCHQRSQATRTDTLGSSICQATMEHLLKEPSMVRSAPSFQNGYMRTLNGLEHIDDFGTSKCENHFNAMDGPGRSIRHFPVDEASCLALRWHTKWACDWY